MKNFFLILILLFIPIIAFAQNNDNVLLNTTFQARVLEIINSRETVLSDGAKAKQQNIRLKGLEGEYEGKEIIFKGIGDFDVLNKNIYKEGDKVLVVASQDDQGGVAYYITDYVRVDEIFYLSLLFILIIAVVGGIRGLRSVIALVATFFIIIKYLIPQILAGASPLTVTLISSLAIILLIIYITEGFRTRSHIAIVSTFISLLITIILAWLSVSLAKLSGLAGEETAFLVDISTGVLNFKGLLLAGIIIGTLGVLDDVIISQVVTVEQLHKTNQHLSKKELFKKSYDVGISHISSMTNTLFLAYAGVSLPLLILFISGRSAFSSFFQVINNEAIATEVIRTLAGSIGLMMAVPIATTVAVWWYKFKV